MQVEVSTAFTPFASLAGGILIGLSAVLVMAAFGRIAGIAGIALGAMSPVAGAGSGRAPDWGWRLAFIGGLLAAPLVVRLVTGVPIEAAVSDDVPLMIAAGLLVGFGTAYGSGCTSGHGVCGLARLSRRSAVAVATFMASAVATVFLVRHVL